MMFASSTPTPPPLQRSFSKGKALLRMRSLLFTMVIITTVIWNNSVVNGAPAKLDTLVRPFPADLQPPLIEVDEKNAFDSYGNPIESLKPIQTPDGRKVISAQGLQFEIPNYASGITELKKPSDDLLPPFIDKITSSEEATSKPSNPFFSGSYNPQPFSKAPTTTTTRRTTTTTTTTTTPSPLDVNPFEATIPPWLAEFDYADLGPGVPFVYDPNDEEMSVDDDISPPSTSSPTSNSPNALPSFSSTTTSLTSASSIPSKVTIPLPSIASDRIDNTLTQPHNVFVPPPPAQGEEEVEANDSKTTSTSFNTNFAARFETPASTTAVSPPASNGDSLQKVPLSADRESFPPFNTANGLAPVPTKTTFSKSEDGKVITNNIFLSGAVASGATGATQSTTSKYFGTTNAGSTISKDTFGSTSGFVKPSTVSTNFNQLTTSGAASGFVTASSTSGFTSSAATTVGGGVGSKYTGGFGGPPGVLAAQGGSAKPSGFATATSTAFTQSYNKASTNRTPALATTTAGNLSGKFTGSFGGPPGVLRPYDNIKTV